MCHGGIVSGIHIWQSDVQQSQQPITCLWLFKGLPGTFQNEVTWLSVSDCTSFSHSETQYESDS